MIISQDRQTLLCSELAASNDILVRHVGWDDQYGWICGADVIVGIVHHLKTISVLHVYALPLELVQDVTFQLPSILEIGELVLGQVVSVGVSEGIAQG